jgi:hypothetical protein
MSWVFPSHENKTFLTTHNNILTFPTVGGNSCNCGTTIAKGDEGVYITDCGVWDGGTWAWIDLAQDRDRWRALLSAVLNLLVP